MPERSSKRKARRDSPVNSIDEPESSSMRTENTPCLSDKDFNELSEKIEKSVSKRIKDTEVGQREILKIGPSGAQYYFCFNLYFFKTKNH